MLNVKDIMTKDVITVLPEMEVAEAARLLLEKGFNGVPVVDETGKLVGLLCQSDLVAQQKKFPIPSLFTLMDGVISFTSMKHIEKEVQKITAMTVADAMTPDPTTVTPDTSIEELGSIMVDRNFHTLPVVDEGLPRRSLGEGGRARGNRGKRGCTENACVRMCIFNSGGRRLQRPGGRRGLS